MHTIMFDNSVANVLGCCLVTASMQSRRASGPIASSKDIGSEPLGGCEIECGNRS